MSDLPVKLQSSGSLHEGVCGLLLLCRFRSHSCLMVISWVESIWGLAATLGRSFAECANSCQACCNCELMCAQGSAEEGTGLSCRRTSTMPEAYQQVWVRSQSFADSGRRPVRAVHAPAREQVRTWPWHGCSQRQVPVASSRDEGGPF